MRKERRQRKHELKKKAKRKGKRGICGFCVKKTGWEELKEKPETRKNRSNMVHRCIEICQMFSRSQK